MWQPKGLGRRHTAKGRKVKTTPISMFGLLDVSTFSPSEKSEESEADSPSIDAGGVYRSRMATTRRQSRTGARTSVRDRKPTKVEVADSDELVTHAPDSICTGCGAAIPFDRGTRFGTQVACDRCEPRFTRAVAAILDARHLETLLRGAPRRRHDVLTGVG